MKTKSVFSLVIALCLASMAVAQDQTYTVKTLFGSGAPRSLGGYGAISNKFTTINGHHANIVELYGGWYVNHWLFLGVAAAGVTNNIPVLPLYTAIPGKSLSYEYGQVGLMTEYVLASSKAVHVAFHLFGGGGFTMQYDRRAFHQDVANDEWDEEYDEDWFFVAEPGVKVEMNLFLWMRFSPGISYRAAFNSHGRGLSDNALSAMSYNLTLKFGKF